MFLWNISLCYSSLDLDVKLFLVLQTKVFASLSRADWAYKIIKKSLYNLQFCKDLFNASIIYPHIIII